MANKKTTQLKHLLKSPELEFLMEAHNGLSAKIVEEAGFKGIWASGLSMSASLGVRDNNEASWTQILEIVEFMSDATTIPILIDGDTGYGNFNNMRRLVKKLEQRNIAGVCVEDKLFPKTNSFIRGDQQPLADIEEFCGKIKAGKDSQDDDDFCIIARVEAFIAGWGLQAALERANAYYEAGADAVLIHSKRSKPDEIISFMNEWKNRCPVVIVPTKYYSTPTQVFRDLKISNVIWANHLMRSALSAMQKTVAKIYKTQSIIEVEDSIAPIVEVFRLQDDSELQEAEKLYLKSSASKEIRAIILAASRGVELGELTEDIPKAMLNINEKPLVEKMLDMFHEQGIKDISIIRGYKKEAFNFPNINYYDNDNYASTDELVSLNYAKDKISGNCIISYGDILYRKYVLSDLADEDGDIVIVVDTNAGRREYVSKSDFVTCSRPYTKEYDETPVYLESIEFREIKPGESFDGEWIGVLKSNNIGSEAIAASLSTLSAKPDFKKMKMTDLLSHLISKGIKINVIYIDGHWLDIDNVKDLPLGSKY
jgi:phosphoenolpyruvate phosphomutase